MCPKADIWLSKTMSAEPHADFSPEKFGVCCEQSPASVHHSLCLSADPSVVNGCCEDYSFCIIQQRVECLHVVINPAPFIANAEITVLAEADIFAPDREAFSFKTPLLKHAQRFSQHKLRCLLTRASANSDNNSSHPPLLLPTAPTALSYPHLSSFHSLLLRSPLALLLCFCFASRVKGKACPLPHNTPLNDRRMGIPLAVQSRSECSHTQGIPKRPPRHA